MNSRKILLRTGTRPSPLALKQAAEIQSLLPGVMLETVIIATRGDRDKRTPLSETEGSDFFTGDIEDALLSGRIDTAIHSAKDMPEVLRAGLAVAAITRSIDPYDVLISKRGLKIDQLRPGARVGASSLRRKTQLCNYRGDLKIVDIRGNIGERLELLDGRDLDAIVLAAAGLIRLGFEKRIAQRIPLDILRPHPLQGALAIEVRAEDKELAELFRSLDTRNG